MRQHREWYRVNQCDMLFQTGLEWKTLLIAATIILKA